jgi:hypothetical protein
LIVGQSLGTLNIRKENAMSLFEIPKDITDYLAVLDEFIATTGGTASPKGQKRFRCARSPGICLGLWGERDAVFLYQCLHAYKFERMT